MHHDARVLTPAVIASGRGSAPRFCLPQAEDEAHVASVFPLPLAGEGGALVRARRVGAGSTEISHLFALQHSGSAAAVRPE